MKKIHECTVDAVGRVSGRYRLVALNMSIVIGWLIIGSWLTGCAAGKSQQAQPPREIVILERSPSLNQGQPVPNAEMAEDLAELALTQRGINCRDLVPRVSFFEDVYRVTFEGKSNLKESSVYRVEINAKTSEIIKAVRLIEHTEK
jgi:hypothetical protein